MTQKKGKKGSRKNRLPKKLQTAVSTFVMCHDLVAVQMHVVELSFRDIRQNPDHYTDESDESKFSDSLDLISFLGVLNESKHELS